ncbi:MAG: IS200/IS605 family element transposase accessory protein TnpB [Candidatus Sericytochromatia bacterium]|nr:IS200/IS605 family element transposase accessory protein TnpB [Candidatus Sericytochromatia bacterium]
MQTTLTSTFMEQSNYKSIVKKLDVFVVNYNKVKHKLYKDIIEFLIDNNTNKLSSAKHNELKSTYQKNYNINSRHYNSLFIELTGNISSVLALNKVYLQDTQDKILSLNKTIKYKQKTLDSLIKKIANQDYKIKTSISIQKVDQSNLKSLKNKLYFLNKNLLKATTKVGKLKDINESGNPHLCFGSKKNFRQQFELKKDNNLTGLKTKEDWDKLWFQSRNKTFSLVGSADETGGNSNCQLIVIDQEHTQNNIFELKVNIYPEAIKHSDKYLKVKIKVHNDVKNYLFTVFNNKEIKQALTYRFYRNYNSKSGRFDDYKVFISLDKAKQQPKIISSKQLGTVGIDINADHISMTEVDRNGNLLFTHDFKLNLKDKTSEQSTNNIALAVKEITDYAVKVNKPIVIESLDFSQKRLELKSGINKKYNVMLNSFAYAKIIELFKSRCFDKGLEVIEVNPAFTSKIGKFKYQNLYKLTTHQAASLVIARRGLLSYQKIVKLEYKNKETKEVISKDKLITVINKEKTISIRTTKHYPFELPARNIQMKNNFYWKEIEQNYIKAKKNRKLLKNKVLIPNKQDLLGEISVVVDSFGVQALESTVALNPYLTVPF